MLGDDANKLFVQAVEWQADNERRAGYDTKVGLAVIGAASAAVGAIDRSSAAKPYVHQGRQTLAQLMHSYRAEPGEYSDGSSSIGSLKHCYVSLLSQAGVVDFPNT